MNSISKHMKYAVTILGALVAIVVAFVHTSTNDSRPHSATTDEVQSIHVAESPPRDLSKAAISELKKLSRIRRHQEAESDTAASELENFDMPSVKITATQMAKMKIIRSVISDHFFDKAPAIFDEILAEQEKNTQWTDAVESELTGILQKDTFEGTVLEEVTCHETMCKMTFASQSEEAEKKFQAEGLISDTFIAPKYGFNRPQEDGTTRTVMYMGEHGKDFEMAKDVDDRLYYRLTGETTDEIQPTQEQIENAFASFGM